jgi:hypothetical protein
MSVYFEKNNLIEEQNQILLYKSGFLNDEKDKNFEIL